MLSREQAAKLEKLSGHVPPVLEALVAWCYCCCETGIKRVCKQSGPLLTSQTYREGSIHWAILGAYKDRKTAGQS